MEDYDEGLARNLIALAGSGDLYRGIAEKKLKAVDLNEDKTRLTFSFEDDSKVVFGVEGDCCSSSWIEHIDVPPAVLGQEIVAVHDARVSQTEDHNEHECLQVYKTTFRTMRGDIVLEYRNSSNGYYGGYLVRIPEGE